MGTNEINITSQYLFRPLGLIGKNETLAESTLGQLDFIMAFIGDIEQENNYICPVYLLFSDKYASALSDFIESEYLRNPSDKRGILVEDYDYPGFIVLVYEFPEKYRADYNKITFGKYSTTSSWFKSCFPRKLKGSENLTRASMILEKSVEYKRDLQRRYDVLLEEEAELESIMNIDNTDPYSPNELLDINEYL